MDPQIPHYLTFIPVGYSVLVPSTDHYPNYMDYFGLAEEEEQFDQELEDEEEDNGGQLFVYNSNDISSVTTSSQGGVNVDGGMLSENDETTPSNRGEANGLFCPICFEGSPSGGDHHVCCLPCGHIYGLSCIKKWLERPSSSMCPQCKKACQIKDIRLLYATRVVALDGELQKKVKSLEAKCASLEKQGAELAKKEAVWKKKEDDFCQRIKFLTEIQQQAKQSLVHFQAQTRMRMQAQINEYMNLMQQAHAFMFPPLPGPRP